jgi:hypothetical protein
VTDRLTGSAFVKFYREDGNLIIAPAYGSRGQVQRTLRLLRAFVRSRDFQRSERTSGGGGFRHDGRRAIRT